MWNLGRIEVRGARHPRATRSRAAHRRIMARRREVRVAQADQTNQPTTVPCDWPDRAARNIFKILTPLSGPTLPEKYLAAYRRCDTARWERKCRRKCTRPVCARYRQLNVQLWAATR